MKFAQLALQIFALNSVTKFVLKVLAMNLAMKLAQLALNIKPIFALAITLRSDFAM
jgi:hypothetical protein